MSKHWMDDPWRVHMGALMSYEQWQSIVDALEPTASQRQAEDAQDELHRLAPRLWIEAAEAREVQR